MNLPFATKEGYFNGDMFEDWYRAEPSKEDEQLWQFLHNWEQRIEDRKLDELMIKFKQFIKKEQSDD